MTAGGGTHGDSGSATAFAAYRVVRFGSEPLRTVDSRAIELFIKEDIAMATLNHTNLTTYNVPALTEFFCSVFDFQVLEERGSKLAVLRNSDGFLLTLMYDKLMTPEQGYPGLFHVGFLQPTTQAVDLIHEALSSRNYVAPQPEKLQRGGPPTYGFYSEAPGGVLVEVSTMNFAESV
jgi:hypothetical protein